MIPIDQMNNHITENPIRKKRKKKKTKARQFNDSANSSILNLIINNYFYVEDHTVQACDLLTREIKKMPLVQHHKSNSLYSCDEHFDGTPKPAIGDSQSITCILPNESELKTHSYPYESPTDSAKFALEDL